MHRPDHTDYVVHFTSGENALPNLRAILKDGIIKANSLPWVGSEAVCFTECPWSSLLGHARRYSPYGIGFNKPHVFAAGGGPAYYVRADHWQSQQWCETTKAFVTPFWPEYRKAEQKTPGFLKGKTIDYSHEREWRVAHDFKFRLDQVMFVVMEKYEDMATFPKELKDEIGREKFILMEMYLKIEELWPTHIL